MSRFIHLPLLVTMYHDMKRVQTLNQILEMSFLWPLFLVWSSYMVSNFLQTNTAFKDNRKPLDVTGFISNSDAKVWF